ncbi:MAG: HD domain-containing phosphohydrolase [Bacteriovoracaceae bacterium]
MSSKLKLLLVDPSKEWLQKAKPFFESKMYEVETASTGREAQLKLYQNEYFTVILNLEVENHSGTQVLKYIKSHALQVNLLCMLSSNDKVTSGVIKPKDLEKVGITDLLIQPFELGVLLNSLEGHQDIGQMFSQLKTKDSISAEENVEANDSEFTKVSINEFISTKVVLFDVYVRLDSAKYVKILHSGDSLASDRIEKYKNEKNVKFLYFKSSDRQKYIKFCNSIAEQTFTSNAVSAGQKVSLIKNISEKYLEEVHTRGLKPQVVLQGKEVCENIYNLVQGEKKLYQILREFQEMDPNAYSHAFLVCFISSMIVKQFTWQSLITTETIALASMFHDIGKMKMPEAIRNKRPKDMTPDELEEYKKHPEAGFAIVSESLMISQGVKQIILQHHEANDGSGFPYGLKDSRIFTLAKILFLADEFSHSLKEDNLLPVQGLKKLLANPDSTRRYNGIILENFIKVFADPDKIPKPKDDMPSNSRVVKSR